MKLPLLIECFRLIFNSSPLYTILNLINNILSGLLTALNVYSLSLLLNSLQNLSVSSISLLYPFLLYALIQIIVLIVENTSSYINQSLFLKAEYYLNNIYIDKCNELTLDDFENEKIYDELSKAKELGKDKIIEVYYKLLALFESIVTITSVISVILNFSNVSWLLIFLVPIVSMLVNLKLGKEFFITEKMNVNHLRRAEYLSYLMTTNIAIKEIISFSSGNYIVSKYKSFLKKILANSKYIFNKYFLFNFLLDFAELMIKLIIIYQNIIAVSKNQILIGDVTGTIISVQTVVDKFKLILSNITELYKNLIYVEEFLNFTHRLPKKTQSIFLSEPIKKFEIKNLTFKYGSSQLALDNINLSLSKKQPLVIIGLNGAGKSTLIKAIAGLYNNYSGSILVNNIELKDIIFNSYSNKVGIVYQDYNKYELSLRENLAIIDPPSMNNDKSLTKALNQVGLDKLLNKPLDTQMGNWFGGLELSKGQWQRIAIARIFIKNPDLIIMDEPTASLDPIIEQEVLDMLFNYSTERFLVIVSHNIDLLLKYNPFFVFLKDGKIHLKGNQLDLKDEDDFKNLLIQTK